MNNFEQFSKISDKYMLPEGEGDNKASQITAAVNKLIYKWFNDGDVYDNNYFLQGWANDLSDYANWLQKNVKGADAILVRIFNIKSEEEYETILLDLAKLCLNEEFLEKESKNPSTGSIYDCDGDFCFTNYEDDSEEDDEDWY